MATNKNPLDEIKKHEEAIAALKNDAVAALKDKRRALQSELTGIEAEISKLTGAAPGEVKTRKSRSPSVAITIEQVVKAIKDGATNNVRIAQALGCSAAKVKATVAHGGKAAGITSTGERASFAYSLKK